MYREIIWPNNGEAYQVVRVIPENQLKNPDFDILKKWFHCDTVLRRCEHLYFCNIIEKIDYEDIVNKEVFDDLKLNGWTKEKPLCIGIGDKGEIFVHTGNHRLAMINANIDRIKKYRLLHFRFPINNLKKIYCKLKYIKFPDNHKSYRVLTDGTNFYPNGLIPKWNR